MVIVQRLQMNSSSVTPPSELNSIPSNFQTFLIIFLSKSEINTLLKY